MLFLKWHHAELESEVDQFADQAHILILLVAEVRVGLCVRRSLHLRWENFVQLLGLLIGELHCNKLSVCRQVKHVE